MEFDLDLVKMGTGPPQSICRDGQILRLRYPDRIWRAVPGSLRPYIYQGGALAAVVFKAAARRVTQRIFEEKQSTQHICIRLMNTK